MANDTDNESRIRGGYDLLDPEGTEMEDKKGENLFKTGPKR